MNSITKTKKFVIRYRSAYGDEWKDSSEEFNSLEEVREQADRLYTVNPNICIIKLEIRESEVMFYPNKKIK